MKRKQLFLVAVPVVLIILYFSGSNPSTPKYSDVMPVVPHEAFALENYIAQGESKHHIKPDNEARIVWADSAKKKTPYSVVYIHGFFASQM
jgi:hypothetical protein